MATYLYRLGRTAYRRWPYFIAAWLVALVAVGGVAASISKPMVDSFSIPGIPSEQAQDLQQELFPNAGDAFDQATATVVVAAPEGQRLSDPANAAKVEDLIARLRDVPQMPAADSPAGAQLVSPVTAAEGQRQQLVAAAQEQGQPVDQAEANAAALSPLSADGRIGTMTWSFDVDSVTDVEPGTQDAVLAALDTARDAGLTAEVNGAGMQSFAPPGGTSELIGIAIAALVLVLTFGSLVAAGLPIVTALIGVGIGSLLVVGATAFWELGTMTPTLATMLGLAVGIDYALFILSRYRSELRHTDDRAEAAARALGTAGSAVVFAGLTVIIALSALSLVRIPFLTTMGLAAAATVLVAVLIALTLTPAILGMLKGKAFAGRVRRETSDEGETVGNGVRWSRLVGRAPALVAAVAVVVLGALAVPMKDLHLALPSDSTAPSETTQRKAADLMTEAFGPGRQGPLVLVVDARKVSDPAERSAAYGEVVAWAAGQGDVANAQVVGTNEAGTGAQVLITPRSGPDDEATLTLLEDLRGSSAEIEANTGTTVGVTGLTAIQTDVSEKLQGALLPYLAVVVGLAFLLLMVVFRSVLVPLTATLGFLLSVLATLGTTILVFQEGVGGLFEPAPLMSFMPILVIGIVFGLAMDYQVFLVTRMREAFVHGDTAREAVVDGFRHGARVVAAAAAIMISVFAAFMLQDEPLIQSIGFALAAAVFFDAVIVRMTLIPALMYLMGDKAWWLPRWVDRILPDVDVEGEKLGRPGRPAASDLGGEHELETAGSRHA
ncbi:MMPL family transporter [Knoellia locipacati]|uniref:Multidrug RND transporter n=1 Tax=Knoellia locipacati TaxID=882824 RepID=A0A512T1M5_9MICO|nr:MMPL family transporter [Knoellia locipacati]GEQ14125.1 multidrug RND transporter [Knoellia locipacati]